MIKIIKRKARLELSQTACNRRKQNRPTVTATVNDWIAESRKNRLDQDSASRKTIADWTAETVI